MRIHRRLSRACARAELRCGVLDAEHAAEKVGSAPGRAPPPAAETALQRARACARTASTQSHTHAHKRMGPRSRARALRGEVRRENLPTMRAGAAGVPKHTHTFLIDGEFIPRIHDWVTRSRTHTASSHRLRRERASPGCVRVGPTATDNSAAQHVTAMASHVTVILTRRRAVRLRSRSPPCGVPGVALAAVRCEEARIFTKEHRRNSAGQTAVIKEVRRKNGFGTAGRPRHCPDA